MRDLLIEANRTVRDARAPGQTGPAPAVRDAFHARYGRALREGPAYHRSLPGLERRGSNRGRTKRRPGHNRLNRMHEFKDDVLTSPSPTTSPSRRCA
jgi:hypothetical protein